MEYHVLSNIDVIKILFYGLASGLFLAFYIFAELAKRDSSKQAGKKGIFGKALPWIVLLIFISELSLLGYRVFAYPWDIPPEPSGASMIREINEGLVSNYPVWGWANDYQFGLLSALSASIIWFCWTVYAFNFKPSNTSWWKKTSKGVAYLILSSFIYAFRFHYYDELLIYAVFPLVVFLLLWLAKVRTPKRKVAPAVVAEELAPQPIISEEVPKLIETNDLSRYMPHSEEIKDGEFSENAVHDTTDDKNHEDVVLDDNNIPETGDKQKATTDMFAMMYCKHCGKRIEADSKFCKYCGGRL